MTWGSNMIRKAALLAVGVVLFAASAANAQPPPPPPPPTFGPIDLTQPAATYTAGDGTVWTNLNPGSTTQPAGTGVYQPFLREQAQGNGPNGDNGVEEGLNTDAAGVLDNVGGGDPHTHSVLMGSLGIVTVGGIDYFSFTLDFNEPSGGGQNYLSLDQLKIWTTANSAGGSLASVAGVVAAGSTLRYNMDATTDQTVWLDYDNANTQNNSGSGEDDMEVLIPTSYFAGYNANDYMYFYAVFGEAGSPASTLNPDPSWYGEDGFEEWRVHTGDNGGGPTGGGGGGAPEPMSMFLIGGGLLGILATRNRKN